MLLGKFECEIVSHHIEPQGTRKGPQIVLKFQVTNKLNADGTKEPVEGEVFRTKWMTITEKTVDRYSEDLAFLGFQGDPSQLDPSAGDQFVSLAGTTGTFYSKKSTYQGTEREDWNVDRPKASRAPSQPLDPASRMEMDVLFGSSFKKAQVAVTVVAPPTTATEATDDSSDDGPF